MSDIIYKIFPRYYYPKYTDDQIKCAAGMLKMTSNGRITFTNYKSVVSFHVECKVGQPRPLIDP